MTHPSSAADSSRDPFDLDRFVSAQAHVYADAIGELRAKQKRSHWMWFIFPQIEGLGTSTMAVRYAITNLDEARAYLKHPILGSRLTECSETLLAIEDRTIDELLGYPDNLKLKSSMTLFAAVCEAGSTFSRVLDRYYDGERDQATLARLSATS